MNSNLTEIVFIIDESGSMSGLEKDTVGGFNSLLNKQKDEKGDAFVTTIFFSDRAKTVHDRLPIAKTPALTGKDYCPAGCTALMDTIGDAIEHIETIHKYVREDDCPAQTIFIITTDGMENASHKYSSDEIKKKVNEKKKENWDFIFLGANIDAVETAAQYGIEAPCAVDYVCDDEGTMINYCCMSEAISSKRKTGKISKHWKAAAEADYKKRG